VSAAGVALPGTADEPAPHTDTAHAVELEPGPDPLDTGKQRRQGDRDGEDHRQEEVRRDPEPGEKHGGDQATDGLDSVAEKPGPA
jgi:hypothetical protein